jgi:hypothetical protein
MDIRILSIPHSQMRFRHLGEGGIGDWWDCNGVTEIRVSELDNWLYERLVAIHELVEDTLVKVAGISGKWYDGRIDDGREPIAKQHETAEIVERIVAQAAGVDWRVYDEYIKWWLENQKI